MIDSDTRTGRLELLEPCTEDWHCLMSILGVTNKMYTHTYNMNSTLLSRITDGCCMHTQKPEMDTYRHVVHVIYTHMYLSLFYNLQ